VVKIFAVKTIRPTARVADRRASGSVLLIALWICIGLVGIALYFANSMTYELRAADNRATGLQAEQAIEGAARYVGYALANFATNGVVPDNTDFSCANVPVGDAHFWLIGRDPSGTAATEPYFGLIDEGGKLNLNRAGLNTLSYLPNMTTDFAQSITNWRSTSGSASLDYAQYGYSAKQAAFETVDELRLVDGASLALLAGDDLNRNGVLDANEKDSSGTGKLSNGLFEYATIYSREPNFHSDGTALTNVNTASVTQLRSLFQSAGVGLSRQNAQALYSSIHPSPQQNNLCTSVLDFYLRCQRYAGITAASFAAVDANVTITAATTKFINGRVNANTASAAVLTALFMGSGVDQETATGAAQTLVTYRDQNPDGLASIAWIADALGNNNGALQAMRSRDSLTTRSFQFTADIAAVGAFGRGYRRVKFIFDVSEGAPKILYRQDLSRLGWALGTKTRETLVAQTTTP
jgi:DNA uptake protein ComE-like DNA-binding protein